jgi:hypothetical protein
MDEDHFSTQLYNQQLNTLKQLNIKPFQLKLGQLNSFTTAMYLTIEDDSQSLYKIREGLNSITADHPTEIYYPHITLGLYKDNYSTRELATIIQKFRLDAPQNIPLIKITELVFCQYETKILQGPFKVIHRVKLN